MRFSAIPLIAVSILGLSPLARAANEHDVDVAIHHEADEMAQQLGRSLDAELKSKGVREIEHRLVWKGVPKTTTTLAKGAAMMAVGYTFKDSAELLNRTHFFETARKEFVKGLQAAVAKYPTPDQKLAALKKARHNESKIAAGLGRKIMLDIEKHGLEAGQKTGDEVVTKCLAGGLTCDERAQSAAGIALVKKIAARNAGEEINKK